MYDKTYIPRGKMGHPALFSRAGVIRRRRRRISVYYSYERNISMPPFFFKVYMP